MHENVIPPVCVPRSSDNFSVNLFYQERTPQRVLAKKFNITRYCDTIARIDFFFFKKNQCLFSFVTMSYGGENSYVCAGKVV